MVRLVVAILSAIRNYVSSASVFLHRPVQLALPDWYMRHIAHRDPVFYATLRDYDTIHRFFMDGLDHSSFALSQQIEHMSHHLWRLTHGNAAWMPAMRLADQLTILAVDVQIGP